MNTSETKASPIDLDGLTLVRWDPTAGSGGGLRVHLNFLDELLLRRNRLRVIRMFWANGVDPSIRPVLPPQPDWKGTWEAWPLGPVPKETNGATEPQPLNHPFHPVRKLTAQVIRAAIKRCPPLHHRMLHPDNWPWSRRVPGTGAEIPELSRFRQCMREAFETLLETTPAARLCFLSHDGFSPHALAAADVAAKLGLKRGLFFHGGQGGTSRYLLRQLVAQLGGAAGVTGKWVQPLLGERFTCLGNGIDLAFLDPGIPIDSAGFRARHQIPPDIPFALLPARFDQDKGHRLLLRALDRIRRQQADHLPAPPLIVGMAGNRNPALGGDPFEINRIDRDIAQFGLGGWIRFLGQLDAGEMRQAYAAADFTVLSSHTEGIPRVLLESQAMEKPVIATDVGGSSEAMDANHSGLLVPPRHPRRLAAAIIQLLESGPAARREMGLRGRAHVRKHFDVANLPLRHERFISDRLNAN